MSTTIINAAIHAAIQSGMKEILAELKKNQLEWLERMDVTATALESKPEETNEEGNVDPEDDFKREMLL